MTEQRADIIEHSCKVLLRNISLRTDRTIAIERIEREARRIKADPMLIRIMCFPSFQKENNYTKRFYK